ncbi:MAG: non-canonical purine NTP pyrophosphatase [Arsenophonus sp. NEOnobi-MAG3]
MRKVVLATCNTDKVSEFSELLKKCNLNIFAQTKLVISAIEKTGITFIKNVILKACYTVKASSFATISNNLGLLVNALKGAHEIYLACFAGKNISAEENLYKLLSIMKDIPDNQLRAQFNSVLVYFRYFSDSTQILCHGIWGGVLIHEYKGSNGFAYNPIFYNKKLKLTVPQLTKTQKNVVSHHAKALRMLLGSLTNA